MKKAKKIFIITSLLILVAAPIAASKFMECLAHSESVYWLTGGDAAAAQDAMDHCCNVEGC